MIKVENIEPWGFEHAIRGMRNPMNSWDKSDSLFDGHSIKNEQLIKKGTPLTGLGKSDLSLMRRLYSAGPEHRKYLRQIFVSMDITAPLYWWKEFDTYKVGTVANSCSTMHKIAAKEFELDDFSHEHLLPMSMDNLHDTIDILNEFREWYINYDNISPELKEKLHPSISCKKDVWWQLIQLLPSSYNQRRTVTMNYENVISMIHQRTGHKLDEWNTFVDILKDLPYIKEITEEECV